MTDAETGRPAAGPPRGGLTMRAAIWIVAAVTVARVIALYAARTDLGVDEAQYWAWSQELAFGYFSKPPMIAWIIAAFTAVLGDGEVAVRFAAPLFHAATALVLMATAARFVDARTAPWVALVWITMPAVGLSATLMSTDVPLMLAWSCALYLLLDLTQRPRWTTALGLGLAIGLGLNSKYAMAYFPLCVLAMAIAIRSDRRLLTRPHLWAAFALAAVIITPNIVWNLENGFATVNHLVDHNMSWKAADLVHPIRAIEFVTSQFGVFGPLAFAALIIAAWTAARGDASPVERRLLWMSVPVVVIVTGQAFLSKAYANWAAAAYPAATILVVQILLQRQWMRSTMIINTCVALVFLISPAFAPQLSQFGELRPFKQLLGYSELAGEVRQRAEAANAETIVVTRRAEAAALIYYLRDLPAEIAILAPPGSVPTDHFALTRPWWYGRTGRTLLLVPGPGPAASETEDDDSPIDWDEPFTVEPGVDPREMMRTGLLRTQPGPR